MCGLAGKYSLYGVDPGDVGLMLDTLIHRGPDDSGVIVDGSIGLGSRRLSIIDVEGGHMPMCNEDRSVWIVHNGEIYTFRALRDELEQRGHQFRTRGDTEVILHLYEELGERCVERLSGMFAFAIWDSNREKLVLARDRIGQKPLFYAIDGEELLFASEPKAILAVRREAPRIDYAALHHYLSLRFIPSPQTMFDGIQKLPPAHLLVFQNGKIRRERYWSLSFTSKREMSSSEWLDVVRDKLRAAIQSHLVSDVPVGAFLSGGMDSSMVVAMIRKDLGLPLTTIAIGDESPDFDERGYAALVADRYGTNHFEHAVKPNLVKLLPRMVWHLDEPSDPIAACQFHAAELAATHVKVVLGGDGGDELFAGFDRYTGLGYLDYYRFIPSLIRSKVLGPLFQHLPDSFAYKSITQKLRWMHQLSDLERAGERYAEATCFFRFNHLEKQGLYSNALWQELGDLNSASVISDAYESAPADEPIDQMLYADFVTRLPEHSLMLNDRMSMAHSLELRSPFLDHELVELMAACPADIKIKGGQLKSLLRDISVEYLPDEIIRRRKQGFMFPVAYWFKNELYPFLQQFLRESVFVREGLFELDYVNELLSSHRSGKRDNHVRLWMLMNLEIWHKLHIEKLEPAELESRITERIAHRAGSTQPIVV